jgi:signal transduction histidine kinase
MTPVIEKYVSSQYTASHNRAIYNVATMKQNSLEPGLLSVFRIFTGLRLVFLVIASIFHLFVHGLLESSELLSSHQMEFLVSKDELSPYPILFNFGDVILLLVYLWWPPLQRLLGRLFLPVGLIMATIGPIIGQYFTTVWLGLTNPFVMAIAWQVVVVLFLPLVLIGWQYNFHKIIAYSLGTGLLDLGLTMVAADWNNFALIHPIVGIIISRTILYLIVGYMISRLVASQRQQRQALTQANAQLTHYATTLEQLSVSRERNRLSRELHDTLAHTLSGVTVQLEAVSALWASDPEAARTLLDQSLATTRTGLTETRRALQALRASPLEDLGVTLALRNLAGSLAARTGLTLELQVPEHLDDLSPAVEQCVYRVAQEALTNVDRHANARRLTVQLNRENQHLILTIADDGRGFSIDEVNENSQFGLKGMKERAEMMGGRFEVESQPGQGTTVRLTVPVE